MYRIEQLWFGANPDTWDDKSTSWMLCTSFCAFWDAQSSPKQSLTQNQQCYAACNKLQIFVQRQVAWTALLMTHQKCGRLSLSSCVNFVFQFCTVVL